MAFINVITELFSKLKDGNGNAITSTDLGGGKRGLDVNVELEVQGNDSVSIKDSIETGETVRVGHGQLHVSDSIPHSIPGHTRVRRQLFKAIKGHNFELDYYVIPAGKELIISKICMTGSGGYNSGGIYWVPDGTFDTEGIIPDLIVGMYFDGEYIERDLDFDYVGDGTAAIVTKLTRRDKGKEWIGIEWWGWLED